MVLKNFSFNKRIWHGIPPDTLIQNLLSAFYTYTFKCKLEC